MRFERGRSRADILAQLNAEAERTWGVARRSELEPTLENAASALWRLAESPLELLDAEPDFIAGAGSAESEAAHG